MEAGNTARVWKDGRLQHADRNDAALASLCQAVERAMREHQDAGVHAVILMVEPPKARQAEPAMTPVPVYVDVFESGFSQDSGYGYGV
jgi:hypothetical protein